MRFSEEGAGELDRELGQRCGGGESYEEWGILGGRLKREEELYEKWGHCRMWGTFEMEIGNELYGVDVEFGDEGNCIGNRALWEENGN